MLFHWRERVATPSKTAYLAPNSLGELPPQAFIDFRMRRSLAKVVKIRRDRASLPIAAFQDAIVRAVASNPCVLVAGDTGCGKSTQVMPPANLPSSRGGEEVTQENSTDAWRASCDTRGSN